MGAKGYSSLDFEDTEDSIIFQTILEQIDEEGFLKILTICLNDTTTEVGYLGVCLAFVEIAPNRVPKEIKENAIEIAQKEIESLKSNPKSWKNPEKRIKALHEEIDILQGKKDWYKKEEIYLPKKEEYLKGTPYIYLEEGEEPHKPHNWLGFFVGHRFTQIKELRRWLSFHAGAGVEDEGVSVVLWIQIIGYIYNIQ